MKKITFTLLVAPILFLTGCFGGITDYHPDFEGASYETAEFSIFVPSEFETVETFDTTYPAEIVVAFKNPEKTEDKNTEKNSNSQNNTANYYGGFNANINIIKIAVAEDTDALSLAEQKLKTHESSLEGFNKLDEKQINLNVGGKSQKNMLYLFEGQVKQAGEKMKFLQTCAVSGNQGFILTGTFVPTEKEEVVKKIEGMLKSFALK